LIKKLGNSLSQAFSGGAIEKKKRVLRYLTFNGFFWGVSSALNKIPRVSSNGLRITLKTAKFSKWY